MAVDERYRQSLRAVREMLERTGSARAVDACELRARKLDILTVVARQRAAAAGLAGVRTGGVRVELSPDMEALIERLDAAELEKLRGPSAVIETATEIIAA